MNIRMFHWRLLMFFSLRKRNKKQCILLFSKNIPFVLPGELTGLFAYLLRSSTSLSYLVPVVLDVSCLFQDAWGVSGYSKFLSNDVTVTGCRSWTAVMHDKHHFQRKLVIIFQKSNQLGLIVIVYLHSFCHLDLDIFLQMVDLCISFQKP